MLRKSLPRDSSDETVLQFARDAFYILQPATCNRDDFLHLAALEPHHGIIIIIRRRTRSEERAALIRLVDRAGDTGLRNNINFA